MSSNHVKFQYLDYTFRPSAGLSTRACNHLLAVFDTLSSNPSVILGIYALEIVESSNGPIAGSRHVHIRILCQKPVDPYNFFGRKYRQYANGDDFVQSHEDNARCFHAKYWDDNQRWKLGYLMKGDSYSVIPHKPDAKLTEYMRSCWFAFQDHESSLKVTTKKLAQVTKKNLGPLVMEFHELHWPGCHYNWEQTIVAMVQSEKYNFTFLHYKDIIQIQCGGADVNPLVILEVFKHNQNFMPLAVEAAALLEPMIVGKKRKRFLGYITDLTISRNYLEELLVLQPKRGINLSTPHEPPSAKISLSLS